MNRPDGIEQQKRAEELAANKSLPLGTTVRFKQAGKTVEAVTRSIVWRHAKGYLCVKLEGIQGGFDIAGLQIVQPEKPASSTKAEAES